ARCCTLAPYTRLFRSAVFIGVGFGRIGCLLNGCCFGDRCELPWGIQFPAGSVPFDVLVSRGFLTPDVMATFPLHPTQIYSSIDRSEEHTSELQSRENL